MIICQIVAYFFLAKEEGGDWLSRIITVTVRINKCCGFFEVVVMFSGTKNTSMFLKDSRNSYHGLSQ